MAVYNLNDDNVTNDDDAAAKYAETFKNVSLKNRKPEGPRPTGFCLCCGDPVGMLIRWCDSDCRDVWERVNQ